MNVPVTLRSASVFWSSRSHADHMCRSWDAAVWNTEQLPRLPGNDLKPAFPFSAFPCHYQHQRPQEQHREKCPMEHPSEMEGAGIHRPG